MPSFKDKMLERQGKAIDIKFESKSQKYIKKILDETDLSKADIKKLVDEKREELHGLISEEGALFVISKELGIIQESGVNVNPKKPEKDIFAGLEETEEKELPPEIQRFADYVGDTKDTKKEFDDRIDNIIKESDEVIEEAEIVEEIPKKEISQALTVIEEKIPMPLLPAKEEVAAYLDMYNYVKKKVVDESDFIKIQGKKFMKKSGWRKFIKAFNLSIELIEKNTFEFDNDIHAEVRVRAKLPSGQSVEGYAIKSKSEYYSEKYKNYGNYNLHNLITTAYTRAVNRAISDLVGFGEVSAEEVYQEKNKDPFEGINF